MTEKSSAEFSWIGIDYSGKKISGKIISPDKKTAEKEITKNIATLLSIKRKYKLFSLDYSKKISQKTIFEFTEQLHLLLQASIPLCDALTFISEVSKNLYFQKIDCNILLL